MTPVDSYLMPTEILDLHNVRSIANQLGLLENHRWSRVPVRSAQLRHRIVGGIYSTVLPIPYRLCPRSLRASETWRLQRGSCYGKTNLFIALCRCAGIPAGYLMLKYRKRAFAESLGAGNPLFRKISDVTTHVLPVVRLNNRWVRIDCSDDPVYARAVHRYDPPASWQGEDICNVDPEDVVACAGIWPNIDSFLLRPTRWSPEEYDAMNACIEERLTLATSGKPSCANTSRGNTEHDMNSHRRQP